MASTQERDVAPPCTSESSTPSSDYFGYDYEEAFTSTDACGCFRGLCFGQQRRRRSDGYVLHIQEGIAKTEEEFWVEKLKKIKQISEVLAGPKWKNFIRKLSVHGCNNNNNNKRRRRQFQYDPKSYALNFDDGLNKEKEDGAYIRSLSARFAAQKGELPPAHDSGLSLVFES